MHDFARGREHGRVGKPLFDELQAHQAVVHLGEGRARKLDHVDFDPAAAQIVHQRRDQVRGIVRIVECAIDQVHASQSGAVRVSLGGGGIREYEERGVLAAFLVQALYEAFELNVQHGLQALAADVALA